MPTFTPPNTAAEKPAGDGPLFIRYGLPRGQTVVQRLDGTFYTTRYPSAQELDTSKAHWLGGYSYIVDAATATALVGAGYTIVYGLYENTYQGTY